MTIQADTVSTYLRMLSEHSDNPSGFLALNDGNEYFETPGVDGFVVYRRSGRFLVQLGGPFAAPGDRAKLLEAFLAEAKSRRRRVVAIQLQRDDAELYAANGFTVNQVGASYARSLDGFSLKGTKFMRLRNKISRAKRSGLTITESTYEAEKDALAEVDKVWLRSKGWHVKEIEFMVGQLGGSGQPHRRLFVGHIDGVPSAYISYSPVFGSRPGWLHDLSRRRPDVPPGVMEAINARAIETFVAEGVPWLHFGFTPFTSLDPANELEGHSGTVAWFMNFLAKHGHAVYPASTQLAYKEKWAPDVVLPEYLAFHGRARFGGIWQLLRVSNSI